MVSMVLGKVASLPGGLAWAHVIGWERTCPGAQQRTVAVPHAAFLALPHVRGC